MDFRPHILKYQEITGGYEDEKGNYIPGTSEFVGEIPCRAVQNSKAAEIAFADGTTFVYAFTVYMDSDVREFHAGDMIQVWDSSGRMIFEKPIHGEPYHKQLHTKIYV